MVFGEFRKVEPREVWKHERDFSEWLAKEDNISVFNNVIGIDMKVIRTEAHAGSNKIDILAEEKHSGRKIIIENQLGRSDHDHLGKILSYAASHDAEFMIWVVDNITDEHKCAVKWLNERTDERSNFFIVHIELVQIDNSRPAPRFNIVSEPNNWLRTKKTSGVSIDKQQREKVIYKEFWEELFVYMKQQGSSLSGKGHHYNNYWCEFSIDGWNAVKVRTEISLDQQSLSCMLKVNSKTEYLKLQKYKKKIDEQIGVELQWKNADQKKKWNKIVIYKNKVVLHDYENKTILFHWIKENAENFYSIFMNYKSVI